MVERQATVKNKVGIHARPAALLVQAASNFASDITLIKDGLEVKGKSIMGVMMLAAEKGARLTVRTEGEDEVAALEKIAKMVESTFD